MAKRGFRIGSRRQSTLNRSVQRGMSPTQIRILNPWEGFTPDISYHGLTPSGTSGWRGLMVWGDYLLTRDGFEALRDDIGEITLGFIPVSTGYDESTVGAGTVRRWASHSRNAPSNPQPIAAIGWYLNARTSPAQREAFIITHTTTRTPAGESAALPAPAPEYSGFFMREVEDGKADFWNAFEFLEDVVGLPDDQDSPPRWSTDEVVDWALFTRDIPGFTSTEPYVIWCARDPGIGGSSITTEGGGTPCIYPSITSTTDFTNMAVVCELLDNDAGGGGVQQDLDVRHGIHARSVAVFDARALYLSTVETIDPSGGPATQHPRRVRWSAIGHPFLLDPGYENGAGTIFGVGAGRMDLDEFQGEGVKIEVMGRTAVAVYFDDGVAFLRRTGRPELAFEREIISRKRGLLATRAVANVGEGLHFGIFTDGWYFLDESGQWREVGLAQGRSQGQSIYKWKETFYSQLVRAQVHKLAVAYDPLRKMLQVAWCAADVPDGGDADELNTVWYYDLTSDRVYENTYTEDYADDMTPRAWGIAPPSIHEPGGDSAAAVVASYTAQANERIVVHGDQLGKVYAQDVTIHQYAQQNIAWDFELKDTAFDLDPFVIKTIDRMWFEYETVPNDLGSSGVPPADANPACLSFTVTVTPDNGTPVGPTTVTLQAQADPAGEIRIAEVALRALGDTSGHRFLIEFEGEGNVKFLSIRIQLLVAEERGIGSHAKTSGGTAI